MITERTTAPTPENKHYRSKRFGGFSPCIVINNSNGFTIPNCVGYAWGRFCEIAGVNTCRLSAGNAENWWDYNDGYQRGQTPKVGAVMCWRKGRAHDQSDGAGHVAIVERVNPDGSVFTSESNYSGALFFNKTRKPPFRINGQSFQGFIYNPGVNDEQAVPADEIEKVARDVIAGRYGNGPERRRKLTAAGYDPAQVQRVVNTLIKLPELVRGVIAGRYGNGDFRRRKLTALGYDYDIVQREVNKHV